MGNGTFAISSGETLYLFTCRPVIAYPAIPIDGKCHEELAVHLPHKDQSVGNETLFFLEHLTRRLVDVALEVPCNDIFTAKYQDKHGRWFSVRDAAFEVPAPAPHKKITPSWDPADRIPKGDFSKGGVYTIIFVP